MQTFETYDDAAAHLIAEGYRRRQSHIDGRELFIKESRVDDFYGGYSWPALQVIERRAVGPKWGDSYYETRFL